MWNAPTATVCGPWGILPRPPSAQERSCQLAEAVERKALPTGTRGGPNGWKRTGYRRPCTPIGRDRYFHKLFAVDTVPPDLGRPTMAQLEKAMQGHVLAGAELVRTYEKKGY
jgi:phosphatidylethanolamine-binding protein (PEBP) family uncharacterized protein